MELKPLSKKKAVTPAPVSKPEAKKLSLVPKEVVFETNKLIVIPDGIYHGGKETSKYCSSTQVKGILQKQLGNEMTGALSFGVDLHADIESLLLDLPALRGDAMKGADAKKFASCIAAFESVQDRYMDYTHLEHALLMDVEFIKKAKLPKWIEPFRAWVVKHNISIKIKPDWVKIDEENKAFKIVDWKSTTSDDLNSIVRDTTNYGYVFSAYFYSLPLLCLGYELEGYELVFLVKKYTQMSAVIMNLDLAGANCKSSMDYYLKLDFTDYRKSIDEPSKKLLPIEFTL